MTSFHEEQARTAYHEAVSKLRRMEKDELIAIIQRLAMPHVAGNEAASRGFVAKNHALRLAMALPRQPLVLDAAGDGVASDQGGFATDGSATGL